MWTQNLYCHHCVHKYEVLNMPKIGWSDDTFDLVEVHEIGLKGARKVGVHRRKAAGRIYESPKIILDRRYKDFIGKHFRVYTGRAVFEMKGYGRVPGLRQEGNCIILFFPDSWNKK